MRECKRPTSTPGSDIVFLGGFAHEPNVDAVRWFVGEVLSLVREAGVDNRFVIAGYGAAEAVGDLATGGVGGVVLLGHVPDLGALFDPLGNATHTALQWPVVGEDVVVTGAGPIGVMATAIVRHAGARRICVTDLSPQRLALAKAAGADLVVDVSAGGSLRDAQAQLGMVEGFDVALEMSGSPRAVAELIENCTHGGKVALLGLPPEPFAIDWGKVITHMLTLKGIYGREMYDTWYKMTFMLQTSQELRDRIRSERPTAPEPFFDRGPGYARLSGGATFADVDLV